MQPCVIMLDLLSCTSFPMAVDVAGIRSSIDSHPQSRGAEYSLAYRDCGIASTYDAATSDACGKKVQDNKSSMMTHGCMLWGAAPLQHGAVPDKRARYGESYSMNGVRNDSYRTAADRR